MDSIGFRRDRRVVPLALAAALVGCSGPALTESAFSMPRGAGEPARLITRVDAQPVLVRFDLARVDHVEWTEHDVAQAPPNPLRELPPGPRPEAAWVLRTRRRGSTALVPSVYVGVRDAHMIYVTEGEAGRLEPGTAFELLDDGSVLVADPTAPSPAAGAPALGIVVDDPPREAAK